MTEERTDRRTARGAPRHWTDGLTPRLTTFMVVVSALLLVKDIVRYRQEPATSALLWGLGWLVLFTVHAAALRSMRRRSAARVDGE